MRKERKLQKESDLKGKIRCIGTDGKRDKNTKVITEREIDNTIIDMQEEITEEHIVYTDPMNYLTHSVIEEGHGDGNSLGKHLVDVVREFDSEDTIECVVCDGTAVMTGCYNGTLASAERELGKELQWCVCQLHGNECPMRHVFEYLDGGHGSSGPKSVHGPMGKALTSGNCHLKNTVKFLPIEASDLPDLSDNVVADLSRDQKLLYEYSRAVSCGQVPVNIARQKPGPINHARWLTFCLTALIDYTRDISPSPNKRKLIEYIQKVYVPAWFIIKSHTNIQHGAKNVFSLMQLVKTQPKEIQDIANKYVQINAFFAHSSNLIIAMLADENKSIRKKAVNGILKIRNKEVQSEVERTDSGLRIFRIPPLNWKAKNYTQIIKWNLSNFCEPVLTKGLSEQDLKKAYISPLDVPNYPTNSQSVERAVKLVSDACHMVYGQERRHELVLSKQAARQERPAYESNKHFKRIV